MPDDLIQISLLPSEVRIVDFVLQLKKLRPRERSTVTQDPTAGGFESRISALSLMIKTFFFLNFFLFSLSFYNILCCISIYFKPSNIHEYFNIQVALRFMMMSGVFLYTFSNSSCFQRQPLSGVS
jgi:hypothetical protein